MKIKFSPRPIGFGPELPVEQWMNGVLTRRDDGKLQIQAEGGYVEFRYDPGGMMGITSAPGSYMAGCTKLAFSFLEFPGTSDRTNYDYWSTYIVAFTSAE